MNAGEGLVTPNSRLGQLYREKCVTVRKNESGGYEEFYLQGLLLAFTLVSCFAYSWTVKMVSTCSSEMSVDFQRTTRHYIPEDRTLQINQQSRYTFA
jgi:hypothetical protein